MEDRKYDETLARLKEIDQKFPMKFNDMSQVPQYAGFVKSPQYALWLDYLKAKNAARKSAPADDREDPTPEPGRPSTQKPEANH